MRIRGSGNDATGFGGGWSRSDSFRRKHRLKQKVRGILLKNMENDMAWVEIDGDRLLAQLAVPHREGTQLTFIIEQLSPSIVLKELHGGAHGGGASAVGLAKAFDSARALFEARFIPLAAKQKDATAYMTPERFFPLLAASRELYARYADAVRCAAELSALLDEDGGRFLYQPWLAPACRRQVTFLRTPDDTGLTEAVVEFDHPDMGLVRVRFLHKEGRTASKIDLQRMARSQALGRYLASRDRASQNALPTIARMSPTGHGGIISERLFR